VARVASEPHQRQPQVATPDSSMIRSPFELKGASCHSYWHSYPSHSLSCCEGIEAAFTP
jgi:hypothetical protein